MFILVDENGFIISVAEKKLDENFIEVIDDEGDINDLDIDDNKFVKDKKLEKEYNEFLKQQKLKKLSKKVTIYIKNLLNYLDYDDIGDLLLCKNMSFYKDEVEKIEKWIQSVYEKYEELIKNIDEINIDNIENLLPKYTG